MVMAESSRMDRMMEMKMRWMLRMDGSCVIMNGATSRLSAFSKIGQIGRELRIAEISYVRCLNSSMAKMDVPTTL